MAKIVAEIDRVAELEARELSEAKMQMKPHYPGKFRFFDTNEKVFAILDVAEP